jgi:hypothetical protein
LICGNTEEKPLMELIITTVAPKSWMENGGNSTISGFNRNLVVKTTQENHEKIKDLLEQLRRASN